MDVFRVRPDGGEELLATGLSSEEIDELRDWFCYTKPMDGGMKMVARPAQEGDCGFSVVTAGYEPGPTGHLTTCGFCSDASLPSRQ